MRYVNVHFVWASLNLELIQMCRRYGKVVILEPSHQQKFLQLGRQCRCSESLSHHTVGPSFIKDIMGPTGETHTNRGVNLENMREFLKAEQLCWCQDALVSKQLLAEQDWDGLASREFHCSCKACTSQLGHRQMNSQTRTYRGNGHGFQGSDFW